MKTVIQRVKSATVTVDGQVISSISRGLLIFAAVAKDDDVKSVEGMASKVLKVKLWEDPVTGTKWKKTVADIDGEVLCVSQFTLLASMKKNSPSFHRTAGPSESRRLYNAFFTQVKALCSVDKVKDGVFGAMMDVGIVNDGPVGLDLECIDEDVNLTPSHPCLPYTEGRELTDAQGHDHD